MLWEDNYLAHHGILGQRWGIRRFQNEDGTWTEAGKERYGRDGDGKRGSAKDKEKSGNKTQGSAKGQPNARKSSNTERDSKKSKSGASSGKAKKVLIALGSAAAASALAYGAYKLHKSGFMNKFAKDTLSKHGLGGGGTSDHIFRKIDLSNISDLDKLKRCNPSYLKDDRFKYNCGNCTLAYEMLNRGYDVQAMPNTHGMYLSHMGRFITDLRSDSITELDSIESASKLGTSIIHRAIQSRLKPDDIPQILKRGEEVESALAKQLASVHPAGSRGNMILHTPNIDHWISWKNENGKILFFNPQDPKFNLKLFFGMVIPDRERTSNKSIRLDNVHFNMNTIKEVVADAAVNFKDLKEVFDSTIEYGSNFIFKDDK